MPYKFTLENAMIRKEDNGDSAIVIDIKCENTTTGAAISAMPEIKKAQFTKWPPIQKNIETKAKEYLNSKNGSVTIADELKAKVKTISDSPMVINKVELVLNGAKPVNII